MSDVAESREEIDLLDVIKGRVVSGEPIYVTGNPDSQSIDMANRVAAKAAAEVGKPARIVQVVELPEFPKKK